MAWFRLRNRWPPTECPEGTLTRHNSDDVGGFLRFSKSAGRAWVAAPFVLAAGLLVATAAHAASGDTTRVSIATGGAQGDKASSRASVSADGRYVAFESFATNLVAVDGNGVCDIFVRDQQTGTVEL